MRESSEEKSHCGTFLIYLQLTDEDLLTPKKEIGKVLTASSKYCELTGYTKDELENKTESLFNLFCKEDKKLLLNKLTKLLAGKLEAIGKELEFSYGIICKNGSTGWHIAHGQVILLPEKMLALSVTDFDVTDIRNDREALQLEKERYRFLSERDSLTRLYNKASTNASILDYLCNKGCESEHALLVVDLDNFKMINDKFGHQFGDAVLNEISKNLSYLFRSSDIIGRIGGDEFLVFMKDVLDEKIVREKAASLCAIFDADRISTSIVNKEIRISASIGVALYPKDAPDFHHLFCKADKALYRAKNQGKNQAAFYRDIYLPKHPRSADIHAATAQQRNERRNISSKESKSSETNHIDLMQKTLSMINSKQNRLEDLLCLIGKKFALDRVSVYRQNVKSDKFKTMFAWQSNKNYQQEEIEIPLNFAVSSDFFDQITKIFYLKDIKDLSELAPEFHAFFINQNVHAVLQIYRQEGEFREIVSFDDCHAPRLWTKAETEALVMLSKIAANISSSLHRE